MDNNLRVPSLSSGGKILHILLLLLVNKSYAIEEPRPAIYLQPRNFNPHPYEADLGATRPPSTRRGPILFPPSPPPDTEESNFIRIDNRKFEHPVDQHPYPKVARKYRLLNPGRHQEYDNQISTQISKALAGHARKVLHKPQLDEQKNYAFSYKVVDHLTGDDFSHTQSQNEKATSGEYRVKLPDGRVQIVSYTADKNGYKADVKYEDDIKKPRQGVLLQQTYNYRDQIEPHRNTESNNFANGRYLNEHRGDQGRIFEFKATPATPSHENHIEDYDYIERKKPDVFASPLKEPIRFRFSDQNLYPVNGNFPQAVSQGTYSNYQHSSLSSYEARAPTVNYGDAPHQYSRNIYPPAPHRFRIIPQDKFEIVNQPVTSLGSTVAPAYLENPRIILSSAFVS